MEIREEGTAETFVQRVEAPSLGWEMERRDGSVEGGGGVTEEGGDSVRSDVGDGTFAALLQGDVHVRRGDVAFLAALLPRSGPAVPFVLLYDVQHLWQAALALATLSC